MVEKTSLTLLAESDGKKLSENYEDFIVAINRNFGYCITHKSNVHESKKHAHEEMICPCYRYRKDQICSVGLFK